MQENKSGKHHLAIEFLTSQEEEKLPATFYGSTGQGKCSVAVPGELTINSALDEILVSARQTNASDVHISTHNQIYFKINGNLKPQTLGRLTPQQVNNLVHTGLTPEQFKKFKHSGDIEIIYVIKGAGRFRFSLTKKTPGIDLTVRLIPLQLYSFEESGMPESCRELTKWSQGLVLVTGPIGCGKTTTLSVLCEMINQARQEHIITIENPIEFVFTPKKCQITQRELHLHTLSQANALRAALRQDPDILVISELRDTASIQLAATAAETGHLVLGTMNTNDAAQTILRIVNSFSAEERGLVQSMLASSLRGIICEQLIPKKDGSGLVPAYEVLLGTGAVSNLIRKGNVDQILRVITTGSAEGMVPMDTSLMKLLKEGVITWESAYGRCTNKQEFEKFRYMRHV
ncbi:MAG: PilT/PilU family type 4a pilus ATPase [Candidatus Omnitrophota bacterium]